MPKDETTSLLRLWRGELTSAELPPEIEMGDVGVALNEMYEQTARDLRERAAVLALDEGGVLRLLPQTLGGTHRTTFDAAVPAGYRYVGTVHTHPPHGDATGVAFSAGDIASAINDGDVVMIVQSGQHRFALLSTEKTVASLSVDEAEAAMLRIEASVMRRGMTQKQALIESNLGLCARYGLAFYYGQVGQSLKEVFKP